MWVLSPGIGRDAVVRNSTEFCGSLESVVSILLSQKPGEEQCCLRGLFRAINSLGT